MLENDSGNTFNRLSASLSSDERKILLEKIKAVSNSLVEQTLESPFPHIDTTDAAIAEEFKSEFILYKILLWIRSFFKGLRVEELYAKDKVAQLASELATIVPGVVDFNHRYLTTLFYEYLKELKYCAEFFRPYITVVQENIGAYYVFLSSFVLPDIDMMINTEVDPFQTPPSPEVTKEHRASLLRKMDDILKSIPPISRNVMYKSVQCIDWLTQFVSLPFDEMLSLFVSYVEDNYVCSFENVGNIFSDFVRVLSAGKSVTGEILESIYVFSAEKKDMQEMDEFLETAGKHLGVLHSFIVSMPLVNIGKVVFDDYCWQPPVFGGAEDWFVKFKAEWKVRFDARWEEWLFECKKEGQRIMLKNSFGLDAFPLLENRPWTEIWGGLQFRNEYTAGFLSWYFENLFPKNIKVLRFLQLEGEFSASENKESLTRSLNELVQVESIVRTFNKNLRKDGETGLLLDKLSSDHMRTVATQKKIKSMIAACESTIVKAKMDFCDAVRIVVNVLQGIFNEVEDSDFRPIKNFTSIAGRKNSSFLAELHEIKQAYQNILNLISGIELLEVEDKKHV